MNTPDDDLDPTGMRALLRSLPDPGPMPDDLVARIHSSLAELHGPELHGSERRGSELHGRERRSPEHHGPERTGVERRADAGADRPSWLTRYGSRLAVAALVLVGGSAALTAGWGLLGGGMSSSDTSAGSAVTSDSDDLANSGGPDSREQVAPRSDATHAQDFALGPVVVTMSGRSFTASGLAGELTSSGTSAPLAPLTAESPGIGPIGTEVGVRSCLEGLGLPAATRADVDLVVLDGSPAAIVIVQREGGRTAYGVGRDCTTDNGSVIVGPIDLP